MPAKQIKKDTATGLNLPARSKELIKLVTTVTTDLQQDRSADRLTGDVFQLSKQSGSSAQRILIFGHETFQLCFCSCVILVLSLLSGPAARRAGTFWTLTTDETVGHVPGSLRQPQNPFHHVPHPHRHPGDRFCSDRSAGCFLKVHMFTQRSQITKF